MEFVSSQKGQKRGGGGGGGTLRKMTFWFLLTWFHLLNDVGFRKRRLVFPFGFDSRVIRLNRSPTEDWFILVVTAMTWRPFSL